MNQELAKQIVAGAKKIARQVDSWMSLTNALSDPQDGLIARYFPTDRERREFLRSPEYEEINQIMLGIIRRKGLSPRARRNGKSG